MMIGRGEESLTWHLGTIEEKKKDKKNQNPNVM